ncbi:MAG: hypothetical protein IJM40_01645 [Synergistaceae bacterium]|nr:hypothetical protein [Synergistaceae bacterium]
MDKYYAGQIVKSKQGKDTGKIYVVTGILLLDKTGKTGVKRLALADAEKFNVNKPKLKNPAHVQIAFKNNKFCDELAGIINQGKDINKGRLSQIIASLENAQI